MKIELDNNMKIPLYRQITEQIKEMIESGVLPDGYVMPSERSLAESLGVHRNTIIRVYACLVYTSGQQLYYRTDHHWTTPAAEMAFTSWKPDVKLTSDRHPLTEEFLGSQYSKVLWGSGHADTVEGYGTGAAEVTADGQRLDGGIYQERFLKEKDKYAVFLGGNYGLSLIHI